jgi:heme A synthase
MGGEEAIKLNKKKWLIVLGAAILVLAIGTGAYAAADDNGFSFEQMLPFMKQMHPNFSDDQLEQMYNNCHGSGIGNGYGPARGGMMNFGQRAVQ